jgi:pyridoxamine 5'-phosphate oxidase
VDSIKNLRTDYTKGKLNIEEMSKSPSIQLSAWIAEAESNGVGDSNAFCLSTLNKEGFPTGRIVLARGVSDDGIVFYTNKSSSKGVELLKMEKAGATFFWSEMQRQVRVVGVVSHLSDEESDDYFASRPRASQIGAWVSQQSEQMESRQVLDSRLEEFTKKFEGSESVPRPPHWGGYLLSLEEVEFWQGRASRLHDRVKYSKKNGSWETALLQP